MMATDTGIASGAIANCTDGADEVPIVKWEAQARSLSGVSSVVATAMNKNFVIAPTYTDNTISLCMDMGADIHVSYINMSFLATNAVAQSGVGALVDYRESNGTHHYRTITGFKNSSNVAFKVNEEQNGYFSNTYSNISFRYIYIYYVKTGYGKIQSDCLSNWQVELGQVRTDYVPKVSASQTATLGRTVYGAKLNLTSGTGTENMVRVKISDLTWTYYTAGTNPIFYANNVPNMKTYARTEMPNLAIDGYTTRTSHSRSNLSTNMANMECSAIENAQTITFRNDTYTSRDDMLAAIGDSYIIYETTQTTDFTFNPISKPETYLGVNNFWIDCGDSEVEYYKSGYGYTSVTLNRPTSKNLFNVNKIIGNGYFDTNGVWHPTTSYNAYSFRCNPSMTFTRQGNFAGIVTYWGISGNFLSAINQGSGSVKTFTTPENCYEFRLSIPIANLDGTQMVEIGESASTYEAYSAVTKTAKLHRRIYGGQADVIRGIGSDAYKEMTIKEMGFSRSGDYFQVSRSSVGAGALTNDNIFCTCYQRGSSSGDKVFWYTDSYIRFRDSDYTTVEAMESAVGNESFGFLASTPTAFTFPPVSFDTIEGEQFLFASEGASALTYRKAVDS